MFQIEHVTVAIIICVSLQYIGISYCECTFQLHKDMDPRYQPVYFIKDANKKLYTLATQKLIKTRNYIFFDEKETLIITCPNKIGQQARYYETVIYLVCGADNEWKVTKGADKVEFVPANEYKCEYETGFHFKKESRKTDAKKQCKSMGGYTLYHIGIHADLEHKWLRQFMRDIRQAYENEKTLTYKWFTLYSVCATKEAQNPVYAHYTIDEEKVINRQMKLTKFGENDMRNPARYWSGQLYMFDRYKKENIWNKIDKKFKGKLNSYFNIENHYFVPIPLVPERAMSFSAWRYATHFSMNIVPMWKLVSCTWRNIENTVKQAALQIGSTLDIYTGTFRKLALPTSPEDQKKGRGSAINFSEAMMNYYVPAVMWKFVYNKEKGEGIVFVLHNNPYRTDDELLKKNYCVSICKSHGWKIENKVIKLGETYCCNPKEFFKQKEFEKFQTFFKIKDILKLPNFKIDTDSD